MKASRCISLLPIVVFVFGFLSCSSTNYSVLGGSAKSDEQVALLVIAEHNKPDSLVGIEEIDQQRFNKFETIRKTHFKLLPGKHTIDYYLLRHSKGYSRRSAEIISSEDLTLSFVAKAGHTYTLRNYAQWSDIEGNPGYVTDFLTMIIDTTEGEVVAWESRGKGAFEKEIPRQIGLELTGEAKKNITETNGLRESEIETVSVCGNDYCESDETHSDCPADCFPIDIKPIDLSKDDKLVNLDFIYKGQKSGFFFVVNRDVHEELASLPRTLSHTAGEDIKITKKDFILARLNNELQKENLLPLVRKIESLTPDVHKQARIAISLVQNIPYDFPTVRHPNDAYGEEYPYGVIWRQEGICGEKSDLLLFFLRELGFGTAALIYENEDHRSVGIKCPEPYDVGNSGYCFVEVTRPTIITDSSSNYKGVGNLTELKVIEMSEGNELEGVEEEFTDKELFYGLLKKAKAENGMLEQSEYDFYISILNKYGMERD